MPRFLQCASMPSLPPPTELSGSPPAPGCPTARSRAWPARSILRPIPARLGLPIASRQGSGTPPSLPLTLEARGFFGNLIFNGTLYPEHTALFTSPDGGTTWISNVVAVATGTSFTALAASADGSQLFAATARSTSVTAPSFVPLIRNEWTPTAAPTNDWQGLACSADGMRLAASGLQTNRVFLSVDAGSNWTSRAPSRRFDPGQAGHVRQRPEYCGAAAPIPFTSDDGGATWSAAPWLRRLVDGGGDLRRRRPALCLRRLHQRRRPALHRPDPCFGLGPSTCPLPLFVNGILEPSIAALRSPAKPRSRSRALDAFPSFLHCYQPANPGHIAARRGQPLLPSRRPVTAMIQALTRGGLRNLCQSCFTTPTTTFRTTASNRASPRSSPPSPPNPSPAWWSTAPAKLIGPRSSPSPAATPQVLPSFGYHPWHVRERTPRLAKTT